MIRGVVIHLLTREGEIIIVPFGNGTKPSPLGEDFRMLEENIRFGEAFNEECESA